MSKVKRNKNLFQGMEHLKREYFENEHNKSSNEDMADNQEIKYSSEFRILKKELVLIILLGSMLILVLIALMAYDKNGEGLAVIAEKMVSLFIK